VLSGNVHCFVYIRKFFFEDQDIMLNLERPYL
jgi:hypothetical protein